MKNYIILNGKKSTDVQGLMIQALPPVQKPPMRTQIDTIDGEDGDVVTSLGFAAYDRTVKIGLRGQYRESEVVQFFSSSGEAVFSNEPDMIYQYQIVQGFSLERLRRFREANVIFHVQPVKRSVLNESFEAYGADRVIDQITDGSVSGDFGDPDGGTITCAAQSGVFEISGDSSGPNTALWFGDMINCSFSFSPAITVRGGERVVFMVEKVSGEIIRGGATAMLFGPNAEPLEMYPNAVYNANSGRTASFVCKIDDGVPETEVAGVGFMIFGDDITDEEGFEVIGQHGTFEQLRLRLGVYKYASRQILNMGNYKSLPTFTIKATTPVSLSVNGREPVTVNMSRTINEVTIDAEKMNAYHGNTLLNRYCTGDYSNLALDPGQNDFFASGSNTSSVTVQRYSRWI